MNPPSTKNTTSGCTHQLSRREVSPNLRTTGKLVGALAMLILSQDFIKDEDRNQLAAFKSPSGLAPGRRCRRLNLAGFAGFSLFALVAQLVEHGTLRSFFGPDTLVISGQAA